MKSATESPLDARIQDNLNRSVDDLGRLVAQPSLSSQNVGIEETADLVASLLRDYGFEATIMPSDSFPIVYAEAEGESDRTLICYNHYDVQPADPIEAWDSPPFELTRRDGKLHGRGIADDKGHIISRLAAIDAVRSVRGSLPCRIKFVIEGGEEVSSPGLAEFVAEHRGLLAADACVWETGGVDFRGRPNLQLGMRGILYVQYNVRAMSRDAHSGNAHLLPNAAWRLVGALATIKGEDERVLVEGFYDEARPLSQEELALLERLESDEEATKRSYGIDSFNLGLTGLDAKRAVYSPTANIAGLSSGYEGIGPKTVTPSTAMAKMDFRLVPDQDPDDLFQKLRRHLDRHGFEDVELEYLGGERPAQTPPNDPFVALAAETAQEVYGQPPNISPLIGGSGPMYAFREYLEVPIVTCGIGYPETLIHAPNENIRIEDFIRGTRHMARILDRYAPPTS